MATTVASVITAARDESPLFSDSKIPNGVAARLLDRVHRRLYLKTVEMNEDLLTRVASAQTFTNSNAASGFALPDNYMKIVQVYLGYTDGARLPVNLMDAIFKGNIALHPSAYIQNGRLYPIDPIYDQWSGTAVRTGYNTAEYVYIHYVPEPNRIVNPKAGVGLAVSSTAEQFKTTISFTYAIGQDLYTKAATDSLTFSDNDTINTDADSGNFWGIWLVQINSSLVISTKSPADDQSYSSEGAAIAAKPAPDVGNIEIGYITVQSNSGASWTANTDDLTAASDCNDVNFYDSADTVVDLPDIAFDALVSGLAYKFATRLGGEIDRGLRGELQGSQREAELDYLQAIGDMLDSEIQFVRVME